MCDITMALLAVGTALGATGKISEAQSTAAAAKYNAKIADMNAVLADRRGRDALERGKLAEQRKRQEVAAVQGAQVAGFAANGVDVSFGSPLNTIIDTAALGELDALTIRSNTYREEYEHRVDGVSRRATARLNRMEAKGAMKAGYLSAASTVLTGASKMYGQSQGGSGSLLS